MLSSSKIEEVSQTSFVFKLADRERERERERERDRLDRWMDGLIDRQVRLD